MFGFRSRSEEKVKKPGLFSRLKTGLRRTRENLGTGIASLLLGKKAIDDDLLEELETQLLSADLGVEVTQEILKELSIRIPRKNLTEPNVLLDTLQEILIDILKPCEIKLDVTQANPFVILMIGINGSGKTTTIGKLAKQFQNEGKKVLLAAGDTFRAAAIEQLQVWGERNDIAVIAQQCGADSAAVLFDAIHAAKARNADILLADTAGRLHTQNHLMAELEKIKRVMQKADSSMPHEILLVLDAGIGQNALTQAQEFHKSLGVTGLVLTKLDGTAKGGIVFAIAKKLNLPIRFIGVGEGIDDLRPFNAEDFVRALFDNPLSEE